MEDMLTCLPTGASHCQKEKKNGKGHSKRLKYVHRKSEQHKKLHLQKLWEDVAANCKFVGLLGTNLASWKRKEDEDTEQSLKY